MFGGRGGTRTRATTLPTAGRPGLNCGSVLRPEPAHPCHALDHVSWSDHDLPRRLTSELCRARYHSDASSCLSPTTHNMWLRFSEWCPGLRFFLGYQKRTILPAACVRIGSLPDFSKPRPETSPLSGKAPALCPSGQGSVSHTGNGIPNLGLDCDGVPSPPPPPIGATYGHCSPVPELRFRSRTLHPPTALPIFGWCSTRRRISAGWLRQGLRSPCLCSPPICLLLTKFTGPGSVFRRCPYCFRSGCLRLGNGLSYGSEIGFSKCLTTCGSLPVAIAAARRFVALLRR